MVSYFFSPPKMIKAIIIDDENLGRQIIREYLKAHPDVEIAAECRDAHEAFEAVQEHQPDLLFLDIQMPEVDGFEFLSMLDEMPQVIFSTAYDQYALKAFEVSAIDYLLKPFDQVRFDTALERVKKNLQLKTVDTQKIEQLIASLHPTSNFLQKMLVKQAGRVVILYCDDLVFIEAMEDYANLHTMKDSYLVQQTLNYLESRLNPEKFIRAHRSYIVNIDAVKEIQAWTNSRYKLILKNDKEIVLSRSGVKKLKKFFI